MAQGTMRTFSAGGLDAFGNPIAGAVFVWSALSGGNLTLIASGPTTATFRAGNPTNNNFVQALRASNGSVSASASVEVTLLVLDLSASSDTLLTDGQQVVTITVTAQDELGKPVDAGLPVTLTVTSCTGVCTLTMGGALATGISVSGVTDAAGHVAAQLRSKYTSLNSNLSSTIEIGANTATAAGVTRADTSVAGAFTPYRARLPVLFHDFAPIVSGNHVACAAYVVDLPATLRQAPDNAFNLYRMRALSGVIRATLANYIGQGDLLIYRVRADTCAQNSQLSLEYVAKASVGGNDVGATFAGLLPGSDYILGLNTKSNFSASPYTLVILAQ